MNQTASSPDSRLLEDSFWTEAFDPLTAFAAEARTEFRRGLISGNEGDLAWARLVLHAITDVGLWPISARLLELASAAPAAEFVEPLVFFLANPTVGLRMRARLSDLSATERSAAIDHARKLFDLLREVHDPLAGKLESTVHRFQSDQ
jgi:hypothetical protein